MTAHWQAEKFGQSWPSRRSAHRAGIDHVIPFIERCVKSQEIPSLKLRTKVPENWCLENWAYFQRWSCRSMGFQVGEIWSVVFQHRKTGVRWSLGEYLLIFGFPSCGMSRYRVSAKDIVHTNQLNLRMIFWAMECVVRAGHWRYPWKSLEPWDVWYRWCVSFHSNKAWPEKPIVVTYLRTESKPVSHKVLSLAHCFMLQVYCKPFF